MSTPGPELTFCALVTSSCRSAEAALNPHSKTTTRSRETIAITLIGAFAVAIGLKFLAVHPAQDTTLPRAGSVRSAESFELKRAALFNH